MVKVVNREELANFVRTIESDDPALAEELLDLRGRSPQAYRKAVRKLARAQGIDGGWAFPWLPLWHTGVAKEALPSMGERAAKAQAQAKEPRPKTVAPEPRPSAPAKAASSKKATPPPAPVQAMTVTAEAPKAKARKKKE